jgi:hypothetical protein
MANAYTALSDDANAIFWNPSGLGSITNYHASVMAMKHLGYFNYYTLTSAFTLGKIGGFGLGISYLSGTDTEYTEQGEELNEFTNSDMLLNLGYGYTFGKQGVLAIGAGVKIIRSQLYRYVAQGVLGDIGIIINPHQYLYLGAAVKNIGTRRRFINMWEYAPVNYRLGIALKVPVGTNQVTVSSEYSDYPDVPPTYSVGGEVKIRSAKLMESLGQKGFSAFSIMAGYQTGYKTGTWSGFSLGVGVELLVAQNLYPDIAGLLLSYGYLGSSERLSLGLYYVPRKAGSRT